MENRYYVYRGEGRNIGISISNDEKRFTGVRYKYESVYLDDEINWDEGAPYGTYRVYEKLHPLSDRAQAMFIEYRRLGVEQYDKWCRWKQEGEENDYKEVNKRYRRLQGYVLSWFRKLEKRMNNPARAYKEPQSLTHLHENDPTDISDV